MAVRFDPPEPPNALIRWLFRMPVYFFRAGLGFLFGSRIIMLEHTGRKSGLARYSCVEVVDRDEGDVLFIVSGYGENSQWYRNLLAHPRVHIRVGRRRRAVVADMLSPTAGGDVMIDYARRYPKIAPKLMKLCAAHMDGTEADYREVAEKRLRFVRLIPDADAGR
ncbi:MAG: nitroreductase family deazaflavin-dependent oxidoreductase [Deltaproteobacteria bacterium]|nr:nitroreductase family deazaflavin-dependent oxidoreductase [Deltaproteobacteria bacterium]